MGELAKVRLRHSPLTIYRQDLAPSGYHLVTNLNKYMGRKTLNSDKEVKTAVKYYMKKEVYGELFDVGIQSFQIDYKSASL
jgi:hypothetical protein